MREICGKCLELRLFLILINNSIYNVGVQSFKLLGDGTSAIGD
jgi:hypothetical protein